MEKNEFLISRVKNYAKHKIIFPDKYSFALISHNVYT